MWSREKKSLTLTSGGRAANIDHGGEELEGSCEEVESKKKKGGGGETMNDTDLHAGQGWQMAQLPLPQQSQ
jgi:hypothetical protein